MGGGEEEEGVREEGRGVREWMEEGVEAGRREWEEGRRKTE